MAEQATDAEPGRSKQRATPTEHLQHLLNIGWDPDSPLIQKYVRDNLLQRVLDDWRSQK